ncbi:MAG: hypothetical protein AAGC93_16400 [Cyanobacteria bacterium P01_F01_bin.53]
MSRSSLTPADTPQAETAKSAAPPMRSGFKRQEAHSTPPSAPEYPHQAHSARQPWFIKYGGFLGGLLGAALVSNSGHHAAGVIVDAGLVLGTGWLFCTRFRRFGFRVWLPTIAAFLGFNIYSFFMSGVLHWGAGAYHLLMFFGSITALLFFMAITLVLPGQKLPTLPSRTELAIALAKEEQARLLEQDKTDSPEFMVWQDVLERYQQILALEHEGGAA